MAAQHAVVGLSQFLAEYSQALQVLRALRVRIDGTRLHQYERHLATAAENESRGIEDHQGSQFLMHALLQASDIVDICKLPLERLEGMELEKLRQISGGGPFPVEGRFDPSSDLQLEFSVASHLASNGAFAGFSRFGGDLEALAAKRPVECKRVSSVRRLGARLREGRDKLVRLQEHGTPAGVVLLDVSRPLYRAFPNSPASDEENLSQIVHDRLAGFMLHHVMNGAHLSSLASPAVLGVVARYVCIGTCGDVANVRRSISWQAWALHADDSAERETLESILAGLGSGEVLQGSLDDLRAGVRALPNRLLR